MMEKFEWGGLIVLGVLIALGLLIALPIMWLWNWLCPSCSDCQPLRSGRLWACSPCSVVSFPRGSNDDQQAMESSQKSG